MMTGQPLVVGPHDRPGRHLVMGAGKHLVARQTVVRPALDGLSVDGADLPLFQRILAPVLEALSLFVLADVEIVLEQLDPGLHQHVLESEHRLHELLVSVVRAEAHDTFDTNAVVPASIDEDELLRRREMRGVALKVPAAAVMIGGLAESHDAGLAPAQMLTMRLMTPSLPAASRSSSSTRILSLYWMKCFCSLTS